jgi:hypothetical protein
MKKPILVVLAAGMGSRYGGLKQMDKIGESGEALLDYSVFDALRSGFGKIVFIIRHDIEKDFREIVLSRMGGKVPYEIAFQEFDTFIPQNILDGAKALGRTKPWGTAHALLCAKEKIDAPFAVINADDFYGLEAYTVLGAYLGAGEVTDAAIVPYSLGKTLSPTGTVSRGICSITKSGDESGDKSGDESLYLESVVETLTLKMFDDGFVYDGEKALNKKFSPDTPVSMNFWGFPASVISHFEGYFQEFPKTLHFRVRKRNVLSREPPIALSKTR